MLSVAFLRAINVGDRRVTSSELVDLVTDAGFDTVSTFLASGNVIFRPSDGDPAGDATTIAAALGAGLGYDVPTTVRTGDELADLDAAAPFTAPEIDAAGGKPQVILTFDAIDPDAVADVAGLATDDDRLVVGDRAIHWLPTAGVGRSDLDMDAIARVVGPVTVRTANTIRRLLPKLDS